MLECRFQSLKSCSTALNRGLCETNITINPLNHLGTALVLDALNRANTRIARTNDGHEWNDDYN